jgi:hypothetical protein
MFEPVALSGENSAPFSGSLDQFSCWSVNRFTQFDLSTLQVIASEFYDAQDGLCHKYAEAFVHPNELDFQDARDKGGNG